MVELREPARMTRLALPERAPLLGTSVRAAERELEALQTDGPYLDLTYADTKRFPAPPGVLERLVKAALGDGMTYTPYRGDRGVREQVAANVADFLGVPVAPERNLILTPGSQAALFCALSALVDEGDRVVLLDPDYLSSERMLRHLGADVEHVALCWTGPGEQSPDLDLLARALEREPRVLLFSHPNNPTGATYSPGVLARIAELVGRSEQTAVVVDELYSRLVYGDELSHLAALDGMAERCVTLLGPSKSESMSGYRLGAAVGPAQVVDRMEDVLSLTGLRAPAYAQHMLTGWLRDDRDYLRRRIDEYRPLRDLALKRFGESPALEVTPPGGSAYLFPRVVGEVGDQEIARRLLVDAKLVVNPGYQFGPRGLGHFRVCFAQSEARWEKAVDDIVRVVESATGHA
jgi:aspartate/methionine/tyrosine aminotransferase